MFTGRRWSWDCVQRGTLFSMSLPYKSEAPCIKAGLKYIKPTLIPLLLKEHEKWVCCLMDDWQLKGCVIRLTYYNSCFKTKSYLVPKQRVHKCGMLERKLFTKDHIFICWGAVNKPSPSPIMCGLKLRKAIKMIWNAQWMCFSQPGNDNNHAVQYPKIPRYKTIAISHKLKLWLEASHQEAEAEEGQIRYNRSCGLLSCHCPLSCLWGARHQHAGALLHLCLLKVFEHLHIMWMCIWVCTI